MTAAPDLREQAVEAARAVMVARLTGWADYTGETPEAVVAAVWPLAERAALDGAEELVRGAARLPGDGPDAAVVREALTAAADLVASLRTEGADE